MEFCLVQVPVSQPKRFDNISIVPFHRLYHYYDLRSSRQFSSFAHPIWVFNKFLPQYVVQLRKSYRYSRNKFFKTVRLSFCHKVTSITFYGASA
jgi:hypothetical protein